MSVRAKFLADLKRKAQSPRTIERKKSLPCYSSASSPASNQDSVKLIKRNHTSASLKTVLTDEKSIKLECSGVLTCADGRKLRKTELSSRAGVEPSIPTSVQERENYREQGRSGHEEQEEVKTQTRCLVDHKFLNKNGLTVNDESNAFEIKIKQEMPMEDEGCYTQTGDDDMSFLFSLLPHIRAIRPEMKLRFRNRVNEVVDEFAYSNITKADH